MCHCPWPIGIEHMKISWRLCSAHVRKLTTHTSLIYQTNKQNHHTQLFVPASCCPTFLFGCIPCQTGLTKSLYIMMKCCHPKSILTSWPHIMTEQRSFESCVNIMIQQHEATPLSQSGNNIQNKMRRRSWWWSSATSDVHSQTHTWIHQMQVPYSLHISKPNQMSVNLLNTATFPAYLKTTTLGSKCNHKMSTCSN